MPDTKWPSAKLGLLLGGHSSDRNASDLACGLPQSYGLCKREELALQLQN